MDKTHTTGIDFRIGVIMRRLPLVLGAIALAFAAPLGAQANTLREIADNAELTAAIAQGVTGETLVLAPGVYGPLALRGHRGEVPAVIRSANPDAPAEILGLTAVRFEGLRIEDVFLRYRFTPDDPLHLRPFAFSNCADLTIVSTRIEGDEAWGTNTISDGFPTGFGLGIRDCQGVRLEGLHISRFFRGTVTRSVQDMQVVNNELTDLRMDGMNFAQVENVVIEGNHIHSFRRTTDPRDHADMIQFWTNRTDRPSRNIVIRGNLLHSGPGMFTQSIFMRNDLVDRGLAGPEMFYRDLVIEQNVIINAHLHGITVGETDGLRIRHNTLIHNPLSTGERPERMLWRPMVRVAIPSLDVEITGNMAAAIIGFENQRDWRVDRNLLIQDTTSLAPGFYGRVFSGQPGGDPLDLETYRYRPDGEAADPDLGAARLRQ